MTVLIAPGTAESAWADVTVADTPKALFLTTDREVASSAGPYGTVEVAHKDANDNYTIILSTKASNLKDHGILDAPGVYGVRRLASPLAYGIDVEG